MEFSEPSCGSCTGEYEEKTWIEMQEDEEDDINCLGMFDDPDPLDLFVHEFRKKGEAGEESTITITVEGYKAENGQQLNSTGLTLWRAAPMLCNFMVDNKEKYIKHKHILELGAGLGLCGILAGALGAASVFMTDGDSPSLERMRDNVSRNKPLTVNQSGDNIVHCKQLRWGQGLEAFKRHCNQTLAQNGGYFDVIMGSDIIYMEEILEPLFETVDYLLKRNDSTWNVNNGSSSFEDNKGVFLLAYARRNVKIDDVFATAEKYGFGWTTPSEAEACFIFSRAKQS